MMFLDEESHKGSAKEEVKDAEMLKEQDRLAKEIEKERLKIKAMRE